MTDGFWPMGCPATLESQRQANRPVARSIHATVDRMMRSIAVTLKVEVRLPIESVPSKEPGRAAARLDGPRYNPRR